MRNIRIRCMGGHYCWHQPGQCTADPEYQALIGEVKLSEEPKTEHWGHAGMDLEVSTDVARELVQLSVPVGFAIALIALKCGKRVTRTGWNGRGMYIYMVPANRYKPTTKAGFQLAKNHVDGLVPYRAYVAMKTVDNDVVPWICSQSDMLEDDWLILED